MFKDTLCCLDSVFCMSISLWIVWTGCDMYNVILSTKVLPHLTAVLGAVGADYLLWNAKSSKGGFHYFTHLL